MPVAALAFFFSGMGEEEEELASGKPESLPSASAAPSSEAKA